MVWFLTIAAACCIDDVNLRCQAGVGNGVLRELPKKAGELRFLTSEKVKFKSKKSKIKNPDFDKLSPGS